MDITFLHVVKKKLALSYAIGEFKECTILFSDVVTFTNICSECEPIQIVVMLNSMYLKFDRLTTVHNVYKVSPWIHQFVQYIYIQCTDIG